MSGGIIGLILAIIVIVFIVSSCVNIYNKLIMLNKNIDKAFANIDVLLKQRADEIPNLITVVKQSMSYEQETLTKLTNLRTQYMDSSNNDDKVKISNDIASLFKSVFAVSENYPDLKASASLRDLQQRVSHIEDQIADRREFYNESVNMYNIGIAEFPNIIFSKMVGYKQKQMLEITPKEIEYNGVQF